MTVKCTFEWSAWQRVARLIRFVVALVERSGALACELCVRVRCDLLACIIEHEQVAYVVAINGNDDDDTRRRMDLCFCVCRNHNKLPRIIRHL